jgi:hypothetical protein
MPTILIHYNIGKANGHGLVYERNTTERAGGAGYSIADNGMTLLRTTILRDSGEYGACNMEHAGRYAIGMTLFFQCT